MSKTYEDIKNDIKLSEQVREKQLQQVKAFWGKNTEEVNQLITNALVGSSAVLFLLVYLNTLPGLFGFTRVLVNKIIIFGPIATISPFILRKMNVNATFLKYYTLCVVSIFIAVLGTENRIGIYMTYILVPFMSVLYFDRRLNTIISIFSYLCMAIGVWFNAYGRFETVYLNRSHSWTFQAYLIGFTLEYVLCFAFLRMVISRAAKFVEEQQNTLVQLENEKERYRLLMEGSKDIIVDYDVLRREYRATDSIFNTSGQKCEVVIPRFDEFLRNSGIETSSIDDTLQKLLAGEKTETVLLDCSRTTGGQLIPCYYEFDGRMLSDITGAAIRIVGRLHDVTKQKLAEIQAEYEQNYDVVTGLYKFETFKTKYRELQTDEREGTLVYVFLKNMKDISEQYGYAKGDEVLNIAAQAMRDVFSQDGILCRMHGARFLAYVPKAEYKDGFQYKQVLDLKLDGIYIDGEMEMDCNTVFKLVDVENIDEILSELEHETGADNYRGKTRTMYEILGMDSGILSENDYQEISQGQMFISELNNLLKNSKDTRMAINRVIARVGEQFKIDRVSIVEMDEARLGTEISFQWSVSPQYETPDYYVPISQEDFDAISGFFEEYGFMENYGEFKDNVHLVSKESELSKRLADMHLQSELILPSYINGSMQGVARFERDRDDRFSIVEKYLLSEVVGTVAGFIMRMNADAANKAKSTFLSTMSHEIRTPLNAILGMADVALREKMPDSQRRCLEDIKSAGKGLLTIINDILDFSKIEAGKLEIVDGEYEIMSLVNDVNVIMESRNKDKGLQLILDVPNDLPHRLYGDMLRVKQVMVNLANNAIKYTDVGSVTLRIRCSEIIDDMTTMTVSLIDTGIGIKEDDLKELFNSFSQVDIQRNHTKEGTGLGLVISKQIVELMNGTIHVDSVYEQGSTFAFEIPQRVVDASPAGDFMDYRITSSPEDDLAIMNFIAPDARVLIVDDNLMNLKVAQGLLEPLQMQIDTAEAGYDAIMLVQHQKYDLVFMDHMMPEMDGIEATQKIRRLEGEAFDTLPIIALSANAMNGAAEMFVAAGMDDFVSKPIDLNDICAKLRKYLPDEKIIEVDPATIKTQDDDGVDDDFVIGDLDLDEGFKNSGSPKLFYELLGDFYKLVDIKADKMENCIETGDIRNFTIEVHALKNTARMIGAMELSATCKTLEDAGNAEDMDVIHELSPKMLQKYRSYKEVLREYAGVEDDAEKELIADDLLKQLLTAIAEAIDVFDIDAVDDSMKTLAQYQLPEKLKAQYERLQAAVADVDMETIQTLCEEMQS